MTRGPFVSPRAYEAPGGVPRGLLAGVVAVVTAIALLLWWFMGDDRPAPRTADARAREQLGRAEAVQGQPRGVARSVDEAAERAVQAARRGEAVKAAAAVEPLPSAPGSLAGPALAPIDAEGIDDAGRAARELEARGSEGRIFDEAADAVGSHPSPLAAVGLAALAPPPSPFAAAPGAQAGLEQVAGALQQLSPARGPDAAQRGEQWQRQAAAASPAAPLSPRPAAAALVVEEGTVIPAVLLRRIGSDSPGVVTAMVSMDVYDSRTARTLLLPKGARLVGRYNSDVAIGQARMQLAFTRLILPDGASFDLPGAVGSDAAGQGGLEADVDRHFLQSFGSALLIGVLADRVVRAEAAPAPGTYGSGLSATGQVLVDTANAELQRNAAIPPTLSVPEGTRLNVEVVRDMVFPQPYRAPS